MADVVDITPFINMNKAETYADVAPSVRVDKIELQGDVILKRALKNLAKLDEKKKLFSQWPNLAAVAQKYCQLVSYHFPGKERALVEEVLSAGIDAYYLACDRREPEIVRVAHFLSVFAFSADQIQTVVAYTMSEKGDVSSWGSFKEPIGEWLKQVPGELLHFGKAPQIPNDSIIGGRIALCSKIMEYADIGKLSHLPASKMPFPTSLVG